MPVEFASKRSYCSQKKKLRYSGPLHSISKWSKEAKLSETMIHGPIKITVLLLVEMMMVMVVNRSPGDYAFNGTIIIVSFLFVVCFSLVSRQTNCECFGLICSLLLSSLFSLFLWIDPLDLAIPKRVSKRPLLALAVDIQYCSLRSSWVDLHFLLIASYWRGLGCRCW